MEGSESDRGHSRLDQIQGAQQGIDDWQVQQANAGNEASLANFKEFMAQHGHPNLSPEELTKLYAQFQTGIATLECSVCTLLLLDHAVVDQPLKRLVQKQRGVTRLNDRP
jgi:hypothetical protein